MSLWCNHIPIVVHSLSYRTFIKHLATLNPTNWFCRTINRRTLTVSAANRSSSLLQTLTSRQKEQISLYVDALLEWNQRMNLTAVTEKNEVMTRHVEDSLAIIPPIQNSYISHCSSSYDNLKLIDVGSGAGLPGLIFAIACPGWKVTLLESMNKRCLFLEHAISVTGVTNVEVLRARAESAGQNFDFREVFDVAVARAVAEMRVLAEYCLPLVRVGGLFIAAKGHDPQEEIRNADTAIKLLGASVLELCSVESHSPYGQRTAIVCLKDRSTPRKYPRDPGTPAKVPL
ncbi:Ribosomal rna small subunit methyltransferase g [Thalictrum thalictroides]|uniref:Ribosomal rna small subunit methyltransferase g n=1 Tax=Thalictrum thalictroides TaxID=46969 RepID=A0A7J6VL86_THATH|nr:Ribosomal rna small subunit methyltransferase g [Thalictrum thalictroides]